VVGSVKEFTIVVDTREQKPWKFRRSKSKSAVCLGVVVRGLKTGDYAVDGKEDRLLIERKGRVEELAGNLSQRRFECEMARLAGEAERACVICEFTVEDLLNYPSRAYLRKRTRVRGPYLLKKVADLYVRHGVPFLFCGGKGREVALAFLKRAC